MPGLHQNQNSTDGPWLNQTQQTLQAFTNGTSNHLIVDLTTRNWVTLFGATSLATMIGRSFAIRRPSQISLDVGANDARFLQPDEYMSAKRGFQKPHRRMVGNIDYSDKVYRLVGALEAFGLREALLNLDNPCQVTYPGLSPQDASFRAWYRSTDQEGKHTVVAGMCLVKSRHDCIQYIDESNINEWRESMAKRFGYSALFHSEEIWRVFSHELAVNIWEHSASEGALSSRIVVKGHFSNLALKRTYGTQITRAIERMQFGFLELCACDCGSGLVQNLKSVYRQTADDSDIIAFAFDEFGTSKTAEDTWVSHRHALGRMLHLVEKYGGVLLLRSGNAGVVYIGGSGRFTHLPHNSGYEPTHRHDALPLIWGTHLQVLLPLKPIAPASVVPRDSVLSESLAPGLRVDPKHVRGHLIPLIAKGFGAACSDELERKRFRDLCVNLSKELITRPRNEPLVFDFSELSWSLGQFETFLYLLENLIQRRPVLLVELERTFVEVAARESRLGSARLTELFAEATASDVERKFMDAYRHVHEVVLAIDREGGRHLLGIPDDDYSEALLSLIKRPRTIDSLAKEIIARGWQGANAHTVVPAVLDNILNHASRLFQSSQGLWSTVWDESSLRIQSTRAIASHFEHLLERCAAWRGRPHGSFRKSKVQDEDDSFSTANDSGDEIFNLPWHAKPMWREEFLECSRILSNDRYADEIAQRLVHRLAHGMSLIQSSIDDVSVLACVTSPGLLLATALLRWWPTQNTPTLIDFGPYLLNKTRIPHISKNKNVVIVQDLIDFASRSRELASKLESDKGLNVLGIISFVGLSDHVSKAEASPYDEGWLPQIELMDTKHLPVHSLVKVPRPAQVNDPKIGDGRNAFWIEPRTLRPFRYSNLERKHPEMTSGAENYAFSNSQLWYDKEKSRLFRQGHFVSGDRHYLSALDVPTIIAGPIGDEIVSWIGDMSNDRIQPDRSNFPWESDASYSLLGSPTVILMPLHSQIHYLYPKIQKKLWSMNRRPTFFFLDATLFHGTGQIYRLPIRFDSLVQSVANDMVKNHGNNLSGKVDRMRVLVIDDASATGSTAETITSALSRSVSKAVGRAKGDKEIALESPIEWINYFVICNEMPHEKQVHWNSTQFVGNPIPTRFVIHSLLNIYGLPVYTSNTCPVCKKHSRLIHLGGRAKQFGLLSVVKWTEREEEFCYPHLLDESPSISRISRDTCRDIVVYELPAGTNEDATASNTDEAVAKFYQLMHRSFPIAYVLKVLPNQFSNNDSDRDMFRSYRWAVFEWCVNNWARVQALASESEFAHCVISEINRNSLLLESIFELLGTLPTDQNIQRIVCHAQRRVRELELDLRIETIDAFTKNTIAEVLLRIENALYIYFLSIDRTIFAELVADADRGKSNLVSMLWKVPMNEDLGYLESMYLILTRPQLRSDPKWDLRTVAESLLRGRDPTNAGSDKHTLLPSILMNVYKNPRDSHQRELLKRSLIHFGAALENLRLLITGPLAKSWESVSLTIQHLLDWLSNPNYGALPAFSDLIDDIAVDSEFSKGFNLLFHQKVDDIICVLDNDAKRDKRPTYLSLDFDVPPDVKDCYVLTNVEQLRIFFENYLIEEADKDNLVAVPHKCKLRVTRELYANGVYIVFRMLTNYAPVHETNGRTSMGSRIGGQNSIGQKDFLQRFGVDLDLEWSQPDFESEAEFSNGAAFELRVMAGYTN